MLVIAEATANILRNNGIEVDILPATILPKYKADAFISLHADGNANPSLTGFKIASPRSDYSGQALKIESELYAEYAKATKIRRDLKTSPVACEAITPSIGKDTNMPYIHSRPR